jgi:SET domain-containing protein
MRISASQKAVTMVARRIFNVITPSWYLNHSDNPSAYSDDQYSFFALRDIEKGEELTLDYRTYMELSPTTLLAK